MEETKKNSKFKEWAQSLEGRKILVLCLGVGFAIFVAGVLFKVMHWPGATRMLFIGAVTFAYLCLISIINVPVITKRFNASDESIKGLNLSIIVSLVSLSVAIIGALFKILHLPGAYEVVICGGLSSIFSSLWLSLKLINVLKEEEERKAK